MWQRALKSIRSLRVESQALSDTVGLLGREDYANDPGAYAREVLGVTWWTEVEKVAKLLLTPPHRVMVRASHEVGKTHFMGGLVNWWFDSFRPALCLTTAPTRQQVLDLLWKEVRVQRGRAGRRGFRGPRMPRLQSTDDHWAHGFTAKDANSFQGRHEGKVLICFDEAVGVAPEFWEAAESMATHWLAIFNPTDVSSMAYEEEQSGRWHVVTLSGLDHPNIAAELAGEAPPFPAAIRLARLDERIRKWSTQIDVKDRRVTDIEWPPKSGDWWRPGPLCESRVLGRWPTLAINTIWSEAAWEAACSRRAALAKGKVPEIGCDVARYGDDWTEMHVRQGPGSLHHEAHNGWSTKQTAERLQELCNEWGKKCGVEPTRIPVKVDDGGVGGGVVDQANGYDFRPVLAQEAAMDEDTYPSKRSELWFSVAELETLALGSLPKEVQKELRRQALAPKYKINARGQREVEPKEKTKELLKRSPDGMDAVNLAYAYAPGRNVNERVGGRL